MLGKSARGSRYLWSSMSSFLRCLHGDPRFENGDVSLRPIKTAARRGRRIMPPSAKALIKSVAAPCAVASRRAATMPSSSASAPRTGRRWLQSRRADRRADRRWESVGERSPLRRRDTYLNDPRRHSCQASAWWKARERRRETGTMLPSPKKAFKSRAPVPLQPHCATLCHTVPR